MSWQHLNQPQGWIGVISLSPSLSLSLAVTITCFAAAETTIQCYIYQSERDRPIATKSDCPHEELHSCGVVASDLWLAEMGHHIQRLSYVEPNTTPKRKGAPRADNGQT